MTFVFAAICIGLAVSSASHAITLIHTNDILGEIEPCGCRTNPLGGMARQANLLKQIKDPEVILIDAGDLLFPTPEIPQILKKQSELQARYLLEAMDQIHYVAGVPGEKDFSLGLTTYKKLISASKIQFLAANLKTKSGLKFLASHLIVERKSVDGKKIKIAFIGLVGKELKWPKELRASDPIAAAKAEVGALRGKVDFIVAVTHEGFDDDKKLATAVKGIDYIVGGHSQSFLQAPITVEKTPIFQSSFRNQYVGEILMTKPFIPDNYLLVGLDAGFDSPAEMPSEMDALVKSFKAGIAELNTTEAAVAQATERQDAATGRKKIEFQTFPKCSECHLKQFDYWRHTQHSQAMVPLIEKEQISNKECLMCHTVGLGAPNGFTDVTKLAQVGDTTLPVTDLAEYLKQIHSAASLKDKVKLRSTDRAFPIRKTLRDLSRAWAPVQCENCHKAGGDHPFSGSYSKTVATTTCMACHNPERAPDWYNSAGKPNEKLIAEKRASVTCPAGNLDDSELDE